MKKRRERETNPESKAGGRCSDDAEVRSPLATSSQNADSFVECFLRMGLLHPLHGFATTALPPIFPRSIHASGKVETKNPQQSLRVKMVGAARLELTTLCSQSRCASQLRYAPMMKTVVFLLACDSSICNALLVLPLHVTFVEQTRCVLSGKSLTTFANRSRFPNGR